MRGDDVDGLPAQERGDARKQLSGKLGVVAQDTAAIAHLGRQLLLAVARVDQRCLPPAASATAAAAIATITAAAVDGARFAGGVEQHVAALLRREGVVDQQGEARGRHTHGVPVRGRLVQLNQLDDCVCRQCGRDVRRCHRVCAWPSVRVNECE